MSKDDAHRKHGDLYFDRDRAVARMVLNRPQSLNALNDSMRSTIASTLPGLARDPDLYAVVLQSGSPRAFCSGGDVKELTALGSADPAAARQSLADEYRLDWLFDCFSKPTIAFMDGAIMGSGAGLVQFCTHRVAGTNYAFAMPETGIGFFPDVGMGYSLSRMPDQIGIYLGLTGRQLGRADALALGLVTHCIDGHLYEEIVTALADAQPIDPLLDARHIDPGAPTLEKTRALIADVFAPQTIEEIFAKLDRMAAGRGHDAQWAHSVKDELASRSPTSLKVSLRHLRLCARLDLRETLMQDYRVGCELLQGDDLYEGVRAVLIERKGSINWRPSTLAEVTDAAVAAHFCLPASGGLELPTRDEMQAARI
ncbi:MAG: enoyl-CoA hydratase/isomerase family protein [Hyphomicrobiaceae bacterium]